MTIEKDVQHWAEYFGEDPQLLQAIVQAEGGGARIIRAVQCSLPTVQTRDKALEVVCRSLNHRRREYVAQHGQATDFLAFFASKWAPRGVHNDPTDLNANWLDNVRTLARIA